MDKLIKEKLPRHVAIIMDGNGRWAEKKNLTRIQGHIKGIESVRNIVTFCRELEIPFLTLYAFSEENWGRPKEEVSALMELLKRYLIEELEEMDKYQIKLKAIGELSRLPLDVYETLIDIIEKTKDHRGMTLVLALSYGGRSEIINAVKKIIKSLSKRDINIDEITPELFSHFLYTNDIPDPDLLIRTSGELRISNFLLWQSAYTEFYFTKTLWPDFDKEEFLKALI
ncbi:MAG: isoprenyl transferase, partial [Deltaproteobacteria bacterium]